MPGNRAFIEVVVGLYVCLTFALLVVDGTVSFIDATNVDRHRRPYIWMTGSFDCFFHVIHLLLIVAWAACMYKDNYDGMANILIGISARVMGIALCTTIDIAKNFFTKPPYLGSYWQRQIMHREKVASAKPFLYKVILLFIETLIVGQMEVYQVRAQSEAAQPRLPTAESSPQTGPEQASSAQEQTAVNSDGAVVAVQGAYQAPPGTMMLLVVPVQPPEVEEQQQHSMQSMQPLTANKNKQTEHMASEATDVESAAGTRV